MSKRITLSNEEVVYLYELVTADIRYESLNVPNKKLMVHHIRALLKKITPPKPVEESK